jgi:hypothetical protein
MAYTMTRREMLLASAGLAATATCRLRADSASRPAPRLGASDVIRVGLIGCGNRGPYISYIFQMMPNVELAAVCDVHKGHMAAAVRQARGVSGREPREQGHPCGHRRHQRALARSAGHSRLPGREGCLSRKTGRHVHCRGAGTGQCRPAVRSHRADGHTAAQLGTLPPGRGTHPRRHAGKDLASACLGRRESVARHWFAPG